MKLNQFGRSMIEMLGVLAIIAVLSVGGIAGYSKAMEKFKINKAVEEYNMLVAGLMEYEDNLFKNYTTYENRYLTDFVYQAKIVPGTWKKINNVFIEDSFGNRLIPYVDVSSEKHAITIDNHIVTSSKNKNSEFAYQLCMALATQVAYPSIMQSGHGGIFITNNLLPNNTYIIYTTNCYSNKINVKCMSEMTIPDISRICKSCVNSTTCNVGINWY